MTKAEYMQKLQKKLETFGRELQEDIMEDYRQHFAEGELQGKTDEEIIEELGNIEEMIRELSDSDLKNDIQCQFSDMAYMSNTVSETEEAKASEKAEDEAAGENTSESETDKSFVYSGNYESIVLNGKRADIFFEPSSDDRIHVEYVNRSIENRQKYEYYQYEENGIFYVGVRHRTNSDNDTPGQGAASSSSGKSSGNGFSIGNASISIGNAKNNISIEKDDNTWKMTLFGRTIISYGNMNNFKNNAPFTLSVKVPNTVRRLHGKTSSGDIQIARLVQDELCFESNDGDVDISDITCKKLEINAQRGDVELKALTAEQTEIKVTSGDIDISDATCQELRMKGSSGDVDLTGSIAAVMSILSASGDISVSSVTGQTADMKASSGDVSVSDAVFETINFSASSGDLSLSGLRFEKGNISSSQGDISVTNTEFNTGNFTTSGGDISIQSKAEVYKCSARNGDISVVAADNPKALFLWSANGDVSAVTSGTPENVEMQSDNGDVDLKMKGTQGMEINVNASWGDSVLQWEGERRTIKKGTCSFGNGASKVTVCSKRGDINVSGSLQ